MSEGTPPNVGGRPQAARDRDAEHDRPPHWATGEADDRARLLIGEAIKVRREKAGLTQARAAELIGVGRDTLIRWEQGRGSLWAGGDAGATDQVLMAKLREVYQAKFDELPRNQYPSAPLDPAKRRVWVKRRNDWIQAGMPKTSQADTP